MVRTPEAHSQLAELLVGLGRRVVSFDPPGAFACSRPLRLGLAEMLACSREALQVAGATAPVEVVGHRQATVCQLTLALAAPQMVRGLVLGSGRRGLADHPPSTWHALVLAAHRPPALALRPAGGRAGQPGSAQPVTGPIGRRLRPALRRHRGIPRHPAGLGGRRPRPAPRDRAVLLRLGRLARPRRRRPGPRTRADPG
jgi:hypothetical protein